MVGKAMLTTVPSSMTTPEPSTVASRTQRPAAVPRRRPPAPVSGADGAAARACVARPLNRAPDLPGPSRGDRHGDLARPAVAPGTVRGREAQPRPRLAIVGGALLRRAEGDLLAAECPYGERADMPRRRRPEKRRVVRQPLARRRRGMSPRSPYGHSAVS